jgi:hypothetical protein
LEALIQGVLACKFEQTDAGADKRSKWPLPMFFACWLRMDTDDDAVNNNNNSNSSNGVKRQTTATTTTATTTATTATTTLAFNRPPRWTLSTILSEKYVRALTGAHYHLKMYY